MKESRAKVAAIKLSAPETQEFWEIPVLYEDEHLLALEKPSGLLTSPDRYDPKRPNLMNLLHAAIAQQKPWALERGLAYLTNAQRLDFESSGVILLAKSKDVLVSLANLFGSEKVAVKYVALVQGGPENDSFEVDAKLAPHPARPEIVRIDRRHGKKSRTRFETVEKFDGWALLRCEPFTDRPHQIRVHLRSVRLPIIGDALYGGKPLLLSRLKRGFQPKSGEPERPLVGRLALHAEQLRLHHPVTGEDVAIDSPWPKDIEVGLKYLRRYAACRPLGSPSNKYGGVHPL